MQYHKNGRSDSVMATTRILAALFASMHITRCSARLQCLTFESEATSTTCVLRSVLFAPTHLQHRTEQTVHGAGTDGYGDDT